MKHFYINYYKHDDNVELLKLAYIGKIWSAGTPRFML
jgi:hypothetical protein